MQNNSQDCEDEYQGLLRVLYVAHLSRAREKAIGREKSDELVLYLELLF